MGIAFNNPIEDVSAIDVMCDLELETAERGGLADALKLPTRSLVFRDHEVEGDVVTGYVGDH